MAAPHDEKRTAERFAVSTQVECAFASPVLEDFGKVKVKNISISGVGLLVTEAVAPGMLLAFKLVNAAKNFSKIMLVRAVHITAQPGGSYLVGGTLDPPLTYDELWALVL